MCTLNNVDGLQLRCSDEDREQVAEALRKAAGEGRLSLSTLEERLEATFSARTYTDLAPITSDLPEGSYPVARLPASGWRAGAVRSAPRRQVPVKQMRASPYLPASRSRRIAAIAREVRRTVPWKSPSRIGIVAVFGVVVLDFCEATVPHPSVVVDIFAVRGTVDVIVPRGVVVHTHGVVIRPGHLAVTDERRTRHRHGGPVYWIRGLMLGSALSIRAPAPE
jgi:hypothetical protein